ncbi:hypothetical protein SANT12839_084990 [Streptomyces antimycoticus]|uniref:FAD-binding domain-containing protein n=1 Tax=Streptomyces antimycoticus TaxID=68175 RepID=A0A4D4KML7_9ACTN|nr:hypothetical protein SANT12839_084990 [Streptomyces antimycoticus]
MVNDVVVVGAGPVGLLLAAELRLVGVDVTVIERAAARSPHSKALTLHPRSLEVLAMRGLAGPFVREGVPVPTGHYGGLPVRLDFSVLDTRFPYTLVLPQLRTEQLLEERLRELGGEIRWEHRALQVRQDADGAEVDVAGPDGTYTLRAAWVVGCDGAGSTVRSSAGIDFPGTRATTTGFLGDVVLDAPPSAPSVDNEHGASWSSRWPTDTTASRAPPGSPSPSPPISRSPSTSCADMCARSRARTSGCGRPAGCPGSATPPARPPATATAASCSPGTRRICICPWGARA